MNDHSWHESTVKEAKVQPKLEHPDSAENSFV